MPAQSAAVLPQCPGADLSMYRAVFPKVQVSPPGGHKRYCKFAVVKGIKNLPV